MPIIKGITSVSITIPLLLTLIIGLFFIIVPVANAQTTPETDASGAISEYPIESAEYFNLATSSEIEDALFYDTFTTSEYIKINGKKYLLDVAYIMGYAVSSISRESAKKLAIKSVYFVNKIEDITDEGTLRIRMRKETFQYYDNNGNIMYGAIAYTKLTEYKTTPLKYIKRKDFTKVFNLLREGITRLTGFGRLLEQFTTIVIQ